MKLNIPILFNKSTWLILNSPSAEKWNKHVRRRLLWYTPLVWICLCAFPCVDSCFLSWQKWRVLAELLLFEQQITRKPVKHAEEKSPLNIHHLCFCFSAALCFQITGFSQCITQGGSLRACTWLYVAFSVIFPRAGLMQQKCFSSALTKQQRWEQKLTNKTNTERLTLLHYTFKHVVLRDAAVVSAHR